ncbi:MAG: hypothetical protein ABF242_07245 [Flavobacteriales bacterium]
MIQRTVYIVLLSLLSFSALAQLPAKQINKVGFRSQWYGGLIIHTAGWGVNLTRAKFKTYKKYNLYSIDFVNLKHKKEYRIKYQSDPDNPTKSFKFGKLNSFSTARFSFGQQIMLFEKQREKGVEIYFNWKTGLNLGLLKPIYLEVINTETGQGRTEERYDPDLHDESNIYGKAGFSRGFSEMKYLPGAHIKGGFKFELARKRERIFAIETGIIIDVFPTEVSILAEQKDEIAFYNFYINIFIGKKYYE